MEDYKILQKVKDLTRDFVCRTLPHESEFFDTLWDDISKFLQNEEPLAVNGLGAISAPLQSATPFVAFVILNALKLAQEKPLNLPERISKELERINEKLNISEDFMNEIIFHVINNLESEIIHNPENWFFLGSPDEVFQRAMKVKDFCSRKLDFIHTQGLFKYYTSHGNSHSQQILKNIANIAVANEVELSPYERTLLYYSAYCHDIGLINFWGEDFNNIEVCERVRKKHHERSYRYIEENWKEIGFESEREAILVGNICIAHSSKFDINLIPEEDEIFVDGEMKKVRTRFLAGLLRLADALDADYSRLPPDSYREGSSIPFKSQQEYWKHEVVEKVAFKKGKIIVAMKIKHVYPDNLDISEEVKSILHKELNSVKDIFSKYNLNLTYEFNTIRSVYLRERPVFG